MREMQGQFARECNLCGFSGKFLSTGRPPRYDAKCPKCMSVERHRLLALMVDQQHLSLSGDVLHFAPEPALSALLRQEATSYQSADIEPGRADLTLDVERLDLPDASQDVVVASHILEHVDDELAVPELFRVVRPGGWLAVFVPFVEAWETSYEASDVTGPSERLIHFGQEDHVRYYGRDLIDRLNLAGFEVTEFTPTPQECIQHGLVRGEKAFVARRPSA